jgi:hypothetical protein
MKAWSETPGKNSFFWLTKDKAAAATFVDMLAK